VEGQAIVQAAKHLRSQDVKSRNVRDCSGPRAIAIFLSIPHAIVYAQFRTVDSRHRIISIPAVVDNLAGIDTKQDATGVP
jgi:hypothetical protein